MADNQGDLGGPENTSESEEGFVASITAEVVSCLDSQKFFSKLDDLFVPLGNLSDATHCDRTFTHSKSILWSLGFDQADIADTLQVLQRKGACCDCEVLYNVAENGRLKALYRKSRVESHEGQADTPPGHSGS